MREAITDLLERVPRTAPRPARETPAAGAAELHLSPGTPFIEEGSPLDAPWIIVSGAVLLSRLTLDGKRHVLGLLGPGDIVGVSAGDANDCTVEPVVETRVRQIESGADSVSGSFQRVLVRQLMRQLDASRTHAVRLQRRSAEEKLASFILGLPPAGQASESLRHAGGPCDRIMLSLVDVADYLSLRMETVCRGLARFRRRGMIAMAARGRLTIIDEAALTCIANPSD